MSLVILITMWFVCFFAVGSLLVAMHFQSWPRDHVFFVSVALGGITIALLTTGLYIREVRSRS